MEEHKAKYEAPEVMPLGMAAAAVSGSACTDGSAEQNSCGDGPRAVFGCTTGGVASDSIRRTQIPQIAPRLARIKVLIESSIAA